MTRGDVPRYRVDQHQRQLLQRRSEMMKGDVTKTMKTTSAQSDTDDQAADAEQDMTSSTQELYVNSDVTCSIAQEPDYLTLVETWNQDAVETIEEKCSVAVQVSENDLPAVTSRGRVKHMINLFSNPCDVTTQSAGPSDVTIVPRRGMRATMYAGEGWERMHHAEVEVNLGEGETVNFEEGEGKESEC